MEDSNSQFDVIVVGAGVMGSSTAYQAAKRGLKTLLLEQFDFLHHRGSSHGESRTIRASYRQPYYYPLVMHSYDLWQQAQAQIGYKVYFKAHRLDMGPSNHPTILSVIDNCRKHDIPQEILTRDQVAEKFSGCIDIPENWVGLYNEHGGVVKATKAVAMFQTLAYNHGAVLKDNTEPLEVHVCYWKIKEGHEGKFAIRNDFPAFASCGGKVYVYGTPGLEYPGLIKVAVHGGNPCDPDKRKWGPVAMIDELKKWVEERFMGMVDSSEPVVKQSCMYSMTPDEDFVIDFLGGEFGKDVVLCAGFSGHGFKMAPVIGKILAELVVDGETKEVDMKHFSIERFNGI
ncbi:hypothetical protein SESBI_14558 [Sesbania bispinosa]|nr:hypothetical protein SESBI_14558 [Sesbania bispinosa]